MSFLNAHSSHSKSILHNGKSTFNTILPAKSSGQYSPFSRINDSLMCHSFTKLGMNFLNAHSTSTLLQWHKHSLPSPTCPARYSSLSRIKRPTDVSSSLKPRMNLLNAHSKSIRLQWRRTLSIKYFLPSPFSLSNKQIISKRFSFCQPELVLAYCFSSMLFIVSIVLFIPIHQFNSSRPYPWSSWFNLLKPSLVNPILPFSHSTLFSHYITTIPNSPGSRLEAPLSVRTECINICLFPTFQDLFLFNHHHLSFYSPEPA